MASYKRNRQFQHVLIGTRRHVLQDRLYMVSASAPTTSPHLLVRPAPKAHSFLFFDVDAPRDHINGRYTCRSSSTVNLWAWSDSLCINRYGNSGALLFWRDNVIHRRLALERALPNALELWELGCAVDGERVISRLTLQRPGLLVGRGPYPWSVESGLSNERSGMIWHHRLCVGDDGGG